MSNQTDTCFGRIGLWLSVAVFLVYALILVMLKGNAVYYVPRTPDLFNCYSIHVCMRVGADMLSVLFTAAFDAAARLMFMDPATSTLLPQSDYAMMTPPGSERDMMVRTAEFISVRLLLLLPVLWVAIRFYRSTPLRLLFLTFVFMALAGWPPPMLDMFFYAAGTVADWPKSFYMFSQQLIPRDFATIGFNFLLLLYLARRVDMRLREVAGLTVLGQLFFENNGIVTGVAVFTVTLLNGESTRLATRFGLAWRRLCVAGLASAALASVFVAIYLAGGGGEASENSFAAVTGYIAEYWRNYGRNNITYLNVTVANFLTLVTIPFVVGLVMGGLSAIANRGADETSRRQAHTDGLAALSAAAGFMVTVIIGLFVSGLASDMGRQLLPLVCMVLIFSAKFTEAAIVKRIHG